MAQYRIYRPTNIGGVTYYVGDTIDESVLLAGRAKALIQAGVIGYASDATLDTTTEASEGLKCLYVALPDGRYVLADGIDVEMALALLAIENQREHADAASVIQRPEVLELALVAERRIRPKYALEKHLQELTAKALGIEAVDPKIEEVEAQKEE